MYLDPKDADFTAKHLPSNHPQVVQHRLHEEIAKLRADLAAAQRECEILGNDLADALDLKNGCGPTVLTALVRERDAAQRELAALRQAIEEGRHVEHFHTDPVRTISQRQLEWDHYSYWIHNRAAKLLAQEGEK